MALLQVKFTNGFVNFYVSKSAEYQTKPAVVTHLPETKAAEELSEYP
jgi:hypothetical protein